MESAEKTTNKAAREFGVDERIVRESERMVGVFSVKLLDTGNSELDWKCPAGTRFPESFLESPGTSKDL